MGPLITRYTTQHQLELPVRRRSFSISNSSSSSISLSQSIKSPPANTVSAVSVTNVVFSFDVTSEKKKDAAPKTRRRKP